MNRGIEEAVAMNKVAPMMIPATLGLKIVLHTSRKPKCNADIPL